MRLFAIILTVAFCWLNGVNLSLAQQGSAKASTEIQKERSDIRQRINQIQQEISTKNLAKTKLLGQLKDSQNQVEKVNTELTNIQQQHRSSLSKLTAINRQIQQQQSQINQRKQVITRMLNKQYAQGAPSPAAALLSGNNKSEALRKLHYAGYISQAQARQIQELELAKSQLEKLQIEAQKEQARLNKITSEKNKQQSLLQQEQRSRNQLLATLSKDIQTQTRTAQQLRKDESKLSDIINRLNKQSKEKPQATKLATRPKVAKGTPSAPQKTPPQDDVATTPGTASSEAPSSPKELPKSASFSGKLIRPTHGPIQYQFGQTRAENNTWRGIFIKTPEQSSVRAVAAGEVVFADWLRGFGNIIIIDHGNQYLSVYAYNHNLAKSVGNHVSAGEQIATSGQAPDEQLEGLYFEIRKNGKPINPQPWFN